MRILRGIDWIPDPIRTDNWNQGTIEKFIGRKLTRNEMCVLSRHKANQVWNAMVHAATAMAGGSQSSCNNSMTFPSSMYEDNYTRTKLDQEHGI